MRIKALVLSLLVGAAGSASGHAGGPLIAVDPAVAPADFYLFRGPSDDPAAKDTVTFVATFWPFAPQPWGAVRPRFADEARYEIKIDLDGDAKEDLSYQFEFESKYVGASKKVSYSEGAIASPTDENLYYRQSARITRVDRKGKKTDQKEVMVAPPLFGPASYPAHAGGSVEQAYEAVASQAITTLTVEGGGRVFLGPRDDPFFGDLVALYNQELVRPSGAPVDAAAGGNVMAIALQVPLAALRGEGGEAVEHGKKSVIGAWVTTSRPKSVTLRAGKGPKGSGWQQVARAGLPLLSSLLVPVAARDEVAASTPRDDARTFGPSLKDPAWASRIARAGIAVPAPRRTDLVGLLAFDTGRAPLDVAGLTPADILRLDLSEPPSPLGGGDRLGGLAGDRGGYPNGRRLADDVLDITLRFIAGALCARDRSCDMDANTAPLGDGINGNDRPWRKTFPYLAPPTGPRSSAR